MFRFMTKCSGLQISSSGLANIASGWLTITANIRAAGLGLFVSRLILGAKGLQTSVSAHMPCKHFNLCRDKRFPRSLHVGRVGVS
jgi:hypothetical protein